MAWSCAGRSGLAAGLAIRWRAWAIAALAVALAVVAPAAGAATLAEAQQAQDRGDFAQAQEIWRELAAAGDAEAAFRLGLSYDLGLGRAPDPVKAFRWYLDAAHQGHSAAQFNVGVMLDAGIGVPRGRSAAATWYARSAAKGFPRAQYNLALLYAEGDGLPRNIGLARAWMGRAAEALPAARTRLAELRKLEPRAVGPLIAPAPLAAAVVPAQGDMGRALEIVWTAVEQPPGTRYRVELDDARPTRSATPAPGAMPDLGPASGDADYVTEILDVSSVAIPLGAAEPGADPQAWRVLAVDRTQRRYVASEWQPLAGAGDREGSSRDTSTPPPSGRIAIRFGSDDALAQAFASELSDGFAGSGLLVETAAVEDAEFAESQVRYFFEDDALLARSVATALPVLGGHAVFEPDVAREPGTVEVRLRGGPAL